MTALIAVLCAELAAAVVAAVLAGCGLIRGSLTLGRKPPPKTPAPK